MTDKPHANGKSFANGTKVKSEKKAEDDANVRRLGLADRDKYHGTRAVSAPDVVRQILAREEAEKAKRGE